MLHTNQSKNYNFWKYFVVLPALVFFMLTFQIEIVAQEKQAKKDLAHQKLSLIEQEITAQTTNQELDEAAMLFNQEFATKLEYSKLKRNKKGEIVAIKVSLKEKSSKSDIKTVYEVLGKNPIKSFKVFTGADPNGKVEFGYGEPKKYHMINSQSTNNDFVSYGTAIEEDKNETENLSVEEQTTIGATEISKPANNIYFSTSSSSDNINLIKKNKDIDYKKAFIRLDGKEISSIEMENINPDKIGTVVSINPTKNDKLTSKYGEKAKYGAIIIETLEFEKTNSKKEKWKVSTEAFKLDKENGGFIIHKRSKDKNFEFIQNELEKIGVFAKFSGIERNKEGLITSIKIKLIEDRLNGKTYDWTTFQNQNGIAPISLGKKDGKLRLAIE